MKEIIFIGCAACALIAIGMASAYAQEQTVNTFAPSQVAISQASSPKAARKANRLLAKSVRSTLVKVKGLDASNIVVDAKNGDILLGGSVPDASQIPLAASAAQSVAGVKSVKNSMTIKAQGQ